MVTQPFYIRRIPTPQKAIQFDFSRIDLSQVHLPPNAVPTPSGAVPDSRPAANQLFDGRAAAAVASGVGDPHSVKATNQNDVTPTGQFLLELKIYGPNVTAVYLMTSTNLAVMAYRDYFPAEPFGAALQAKVSAAALKANPGYCGAFGPGVDNFGNSDYEGNYDMNQMYILCLVYSYFNELSPEAREHIITQLLAQGRIDRASLNEKHTSGPLPWDWYRAGFIEGLALNLSDIPETENHVLMIGTTRYLTNQLLYQRNQNPSYDNRRNGCKDQILGRLRNFLRDDFAEYNAKNYQEETRHALLNLCSFAYDEEVRLGARMVLDYVSAHIATSSSDLRRLVPFRRRNEGINVNQLAGHPGVMDVSLLDAHGSDPMQAHFALHAGNTRAYRFANNRVWPGEKYPARPWDWAITANFDADLVIEALSTHRLAPSIHDLFVNDLHRRFYQRLHRWTLEEPGGQRNCDNMELYSGSPSYLISAGGRPAQWVIPGKVVFGFQDQNLGVALPISFLPTGRSAGTDVDTNDSTNVIQISQFSAQTGATENYGVGPDFACGVGIYLPPWIRGEVPVDRDGLYCVNRRSRSDEPAGFYLAIIKRGGFVTLEAFDTWLHPEVSFADFEKQVIVNNSGLKFQSGRPTTYTTYFGNSIHFVVWNDNEYDGHKIGSKILSIDYAAGNPRDTLADAGNVGDNGPFLSGTVMQSPKDGVVVVTNPALGTKLILDWADPAHLVRTAEDGSVIHAGANANGQLYDVWVDFAWTGAQSGDFFQPFSTLAAALAAVADGGTVHLVPGHSLDRSLLSSAGKNVRIVATLGGVAVG